MSHASNFSAFLRGAAIGAAAMYMLDPDKGRRRRALARDKAQRFVNDASDLLGAAAKDVGNRVQGVQATAGRRFRREPTPDDLLLIERVRARIGRLVSHPHAIQAGARGGHVVLSGPILTHEVDALVEAVQGVPGVVSVDEHFELHAEAGTTPSLQGAGRRARPRTMPFADNGGLLLRAAAVVGGSLLAAYGLTQRSLAGVALAGIGGTLATRAATPAQSLARDRMSRGEPSATGQRSRDETREEARVESELAGGEPRIE